MSVRLWASKLSSIFRADPLGFPAFDDKKSAASTFYAIFEHDRASLFPDEAVFCTLSSQFLDRQMHELSSQMRFDRQAENRRNQEIARRLALRFGQAHENDYGISKDVIVQALFFSIWTELCILRPVRAIARKISKDASGKLVLIPITQDDKKYLTFWDRKHAEPFYLYSELVRLGARPVLQFAGDGRVFRKFIRFKFTAAEEWHERGPVFIGNSAISTLGVRSHQRVLSEIANQATPNARWVHFDNKPGKKLIPDIDVSFGRDRSANLYGSTGNIYSWTPKVTDLFEILDLSLAKFTKHKAQQIRRLVDSQSTTGAHICDAVFFESAICAGVVKERGGTVTIWPHSANTGALDLHRSLGIDHVHMITKNSLERWSSAIPGIQCDLVSDLMLQPYAKPWPYVPDAPINVVVIAGGHKHLRLPLLDINDHFETYRYLLTELSRYSEQFNIHIRDKPPWETFDQLHALVGQDKNIARCDIPPTQAEFTNMVFVTVNSGSSALLEGMGRGIPVFTVVGTDADDYMPIPQKASVKDTVNTLLSLSSQDAWDEFIERQSQWYEEQTDFTTSIG